MTLPVGYIEVISCLEHSRLEMEVQVEAPWGSPLCLELGRQAGCMGAGNKRLQQEIRIRRGPVPLYFTMVFTVFAEQNVQGSRASIHTLGCAKSQDDAAEGLLSEPFLEPFTQDAYAGWRIFASSRDDQKVAPPAKVGPFDKAYK